MIGIYKIENQLNHKVYIGQSRCISKRWRNHKADAFNPNSGSYNYPLYRSMRKNGIEHFTFEVIEECLISELNSREIFWINFYDATNSEKGYNISQGGSIPVNSRLQAEEVLEIISLLKDTVMTQRSIAKQFHVSEYTINKINSGEAYVQQGITYPVRPFIKKRYFCTECHKEISGTGTTGKCRECAMKATRLLERPSREELKHLIRTKPFTHIGKMFNISDNAIRKWCKSVNLPFKSSEIKKYTDEEWEKI